LTTKTPPTKTSPLSAVVISTDGEFRAACRGILEDADIPVEFGTSIARPFTAIGDAELDELERAGPELVIVDLESDPQVGLRFIQFLVESRRVGAVVAAESELTQEVLLQCMRVGVTEVLSKPLEPDETRAALERVFRKAGRPAKEEGGVGAGRAITVFGAKGGVGVTALATNLAVAIHRLTRQRTLLLDLDVELGETAFLLGMEPKFSLLDLIRNFHRLDSGLLDSFIGHHESGIELLAAPGQPADFDAVNGNRMRQVLGFLREHFEWVVIDKPKSFHTAFDCVLEDSDESYLVTTPDLQALRNITRSLPRLQKAKGSGDGPPLRLVVNRWQGEELVSLKEIERTVGLDVFHFLRNDFGAIREAINEGSPVVLQRSSSYGADVQKLAVIITGMAPTEAPRKGLFGGLLAPFRKGRS
jgi:pilus assembly protein CpaE